MRFIIQLFDQLEGIMLAFRTATFIADILFRIACVVVRSVEVLKLVFQSVWSRHRRVFGQLFAQAAIGERVHEVLDAVVERLVDLDFVLTTL